MSDSRPSPLALAAGAGAVVGGAVALLLSRASRHTPPPSASAPAPASTHPSRTAPLGAPARAWFGFDPAWTFVNHGSFGATPLSVQAARIAALREVHANPDKHFRRTSLPAYRAAVERLAPHMGCPARELALVPNATTGCQAVVDSQRLGEGDAVLVFDTTYAAVLNGVSAAAERCGFRVATAALSLPATPDSAVAALERALAANPDVRLAVLDHIVSPTALVLPVARMAAACRARGVLSLVDGAHAVGQVPVDLSALGCDYYTSNVHKWMFAPKGVAVLWAAGPLRGSLRAPLSSHCWRDDDFQRRFWMQATRDLTVFTSVPAAVDFYERLGPERVRAHCARVAREGAAAVTDAAWGASPPPAADLHVAGDLSMHAAMFVVRLPARDPERRESPGETALSARVAERLAEGHRVVGVVWSYRSWLYTRVSASVYNERHDYEVLGRALVAVIRELGCFSRE